MKAIMVNFLTSFILILLLLFQQISWADSSIEGCNLEGYLQEMETPRHQISFQELPNGIYRWEQSHFFAEKIAVDKESHRYLKALLVYQELRDEDNKVDSSIVCTKGLHKESPVEDWRDYLPAVAALVIEGGELSAFKLRKYLLEVGEKIEVGGGKLSVEAGRSFADFLKYSAGLKMDVFQLPGERYQIQFQRENKDKKSKSIVVMELSYRR